VVVEQRGSVGRRDEEDVDSQIADDEEAGDLGDRGFDVARQAGLQRYAPVAGSTASTLPWQVVPLMVRTPPPTKCVVPSQAAETIELVAGFELAVPTGVCHTSWSWPWALGVRFQA
jgi:hypothetical protein